MIRVRRLSHSFGADPVLKDVSFSLEKGDFVFLSGPSGAGKTTLLRILYAALPLQAGEVTVAGINLSRLPASRVPLLRRQVGVVFQDFKVLPRRSVEQNIALPLEIRGLAPKHIARRVMAVSRALGLQDRIRLKCGELSGGEQQRVAIARAFVVNPKVLLADEPTGNLDRELAYRLMELFKQFQAYGATVLFATHSEDLMRRHPGAYFMRLEKGRITAADWPGAGVFTGGAERIAGRDAGGRTARLYPAGRPGRAGPAFPDERLPPDGSLSADERLLPDLPRQRR
ncbi:MAG: ATP-binding cassette domain-containing protein [Desulfovibrio sp.]|jgi:cell division transport system ATP-binding protein|nr:ATP-binding cassette domain-containing protein [Desulfovibrio sp.]